MNYGKIIKQARERAGYSQRQLADILGYSQPGIARLERPGYYPSVRTLERIAAACRCRLNISFISGAGQSNESVPF